jgi:hypothetical protein
MNTTIFKWQTIAMLAAGISMSVGSTAWGQNLYQTHTDGTIWQYTGTPCSGRSCSGWVELDDNPELKMIAVGGGALYELHQNGSIWGYVGPACTGNSCPGWVELDNNPNATAIGVGGSLLYEEHTDSSLWEYTGTPCSGGICPGWIELIDNWPQSCCEAFIGGANLLFAQWIDGSLFQYTRNSLVQITGAAGVREFTVGAGGLYIIMDPGIYQYTGTPYMFQLIDYQSPTKYIAAGGSLYQQHDDLSIWQYTGKPCNLAAVCPGWRKIDDNKTVQWIVAGSSTVYEQRSSTRVPKSIWQYTGTPCKKKVCSGWVKLDENPNTKSIVADGTMF